MKYNMSQKMELLNRVKHDFENKPHIIDAINNLLDSFSKTHPQNLRNMSFSQLKQRAKSKHKDTMDIIRYLIGERAKLLEIHFIFHDEDIDQIFTLDDNDLNSIKKENAFYHPDTGDYIEDFANKIYLQYSIAKNGKAYV